MYTLHIETDDATLHPAYFSLRSKREALKQAKRHAADTRSGPTDITAHVVCDLDGQVVRAFPKAR